MWRSYENIPKAIFYLLKGDYISQDKKGIMFVTFHASIVEKLRDVLGLRDHGKWGPYAIW